MVLLTSGGRTRFRPPLRHLTSNRLYTRLALWGAALLMAWILLRPSSGGRRGRELVTGRKTPARREKMGWGQTVTRGLGGKEEGAHEEVLDAFLVRKGLKPKGNALKHPSIPAPQPPSSDQAVLSSSSSHPSSSTTPKAKGLGEGDIPIYTSTSRSQRMAIFVLWPKTGADLGQSSFLLQSFLASPSSKAADLVLLVRGTETECAAHRAWIGRQERKIVEVGRESRTSEVVCLSERNYLEMHRDYLCDVDRWDCSLDQATRLLDHLVAESQGDADPFEDRFRLLRGLVFHQFVDGKIRWLGWGGHDVILGNVFRQFPWDVAPNFDVIVPNVVAVKQDMPVELSPHLGLYQHRPETEARLLALPGLRSVEDFLHPPGGQTFSDLSTSLLSNPQTTFLALESSLSPVSQPPTIARAISQLSIFTLFLRSPSSSSSIPQLANIHRKKFVHLINAPRTAVHLRGTFSVSGHTTPITTSPTYSSSDVGIFSALETSSGGQWRDRTYIFRLLPSSPIQSRLEPRSWGEDRPSLILEWGFDLASSHRTSSSPDIPPPYPPTRLQASHALAFVPISVDGNGDGGWGRREEIWDPNEPRIREAKGEKGEGEWWDVDEGGDEGRRVREAQRMRVEKKRREE